MNPNQNIQQSRIPPQAIEFEKAILGALMIDSSVIDEVLEILSEEVFYRPQHGKIFAAIKQVYLEQNAMDILLLGDHLKSQGELEAVGGEHFLMEIATKVSSSAHFEHHARVILQKFIQRKMIQMAGNLIDQCYDDTSDVFELLDSAYSELNQLSEITVKPQESFIHELLEPTIEKGEKIARGEIAPGIPTLIQNMTKKMGGWRDSELIILAGRPGMGKTAFALNCGMHAARSQYPTAFFSLEMSKEQIASRIIASTSKIPSQAFTNTGLFSNDAQRARNAAQELNSVPFIIDDTPNIKIDDLRVRAKRLKAKYGIQLIILDYLQLMHGDSRKDGNREQEISKISRGLKLIAKELNVPVIALSQLSRAVETRAGYDKRPQLSDLRESGAIEQDADVVTFLYRPEYYSIDEWGPEYESQSTANQAEYIVAKNRNGGLTRNRMSFEPSYTLFSDLEEFDYQQIPLSNETQF